jgi:Trk K+ transport system NAD-binding subunit
MRSLAILLKNCLLDSNIKVNVTVRQKRKELHILLESTHFGDRQFLMQSVHQCFQDCSHGVLDFDIRKYDLARLYGFFYGQPLPEWIELIQLSHHHLASDSFKAEPKPDSGTVLAKSLGIDADDYTINQESTTVKESEEKSVICDRFIVCGLGSLGQHAVFNLHKFAYREYSVKICAIDRVQPELTEFDNFAELLDQEIIIGDCRRSDVLSKAGIHDCRAILLVTSNENVNIEAAIAARRLNPSLHIVVRSSRQNLNQLLKEQLGNFVALDPVDLPAAAFAVAGIGEGTLGLFQIGDRKLRVVECTLTDDSYRFVRTPAYLLHKKNSRMLSIARQANDRLFFQWQPDQVMQVGDKIAFIECVDHDLNTTRNVDAILTPPLSPWQSAMQTLSKFSQGGFWQMQLRQIKTWFQAERSRQLVFWGIIIAFFLWATSALILFKNVPNISWQKAISASMVLLLGGFGDVFGGLEEDQVPFWIVIYCLSITLVSLLFLLGIVGLIADQILSTKFEFFKRSLPLPTRDHIVLIGFGRLGQKIADLLFKLKMPMIIVSENPHDSDLITKVPWMTGNIIQELSKANLSKAKSIISVTDDQMLNLETALLAREANKHHHQPINLAIRTYDRYFSENLAELLPSSQSFCAYALSAEAFAGAAFGENMLSLFRLNQRTVLVAEYTIAADDTLVGKNLSQIAYGYTVVPIYLKKDKPKADGVSDFFMPSDDEVMNVGDRLTVLASISGLRRIELGNLHLPKRWQLRAKPPLNSSVLLDAGNKLKNISGCDLELARRFMDSLPAAIELPMYDTQAYRLGQTLIRLLPIKIYPI